MFIQLLFFTILSTVTTLLFYFLFRKIERSYTSLVIKDIKKGLETFFQKRQKMLKTHLMITRFAPLFFVIMFPIEYFLLVSYNESSITTPILAPVYFGIALIPLVVGYVVSTKRFKRLV